MTRFNINAFKRHIRGLPPLEEDVPANFAGDSATTAVAGLDNNPPVTPTKKKKKSLPEILRRKG